MIDSKSNNRCSIQCVMIFLAIPYVLVILISIGFLINLITSILNIQIKNKDIDILKSIISMFAIFTYYLWSVYFHNKIDKK